jgi:hypothetical protein
MPYPDGDGGRFQLPSKAAYTISILILIVSVVEFGVGIWASVCSCVAFSGQQFQTVSKRMKNTLFKYNLFVQ